MMAGNAVDQFWKDPLEVFIVEDVLMFWKGVIIFATESEELWRLFINSTLIIILVVFSTNVSSVHIPQILLVKPWRIVRSLNLFSEQFMYFFSSVFMWVQMNGSLQKKY